jgi:hypothetical protein
MRYAAFVHPVQQQGAKTKNVFIQGSSEQVVMSSAARNLPA